MARQKAGYGDHEQSLRKALEHLSPVLLVTGEEEYLRTSAIEQLTQKIRKDNAGIAEVLFYGPGGQGEGSFDFNQIIEELNSSSLFSSSKLVIFRRADRILFQGGVSDTALTAFADYLKSPSPDNFLIVEVAKVNKGRKVGKALAGCESVLCPLLARQGDVTAWMRARVSQQNKELERDAADMLFTAHGGHLGQLAGEIDKLVIYIGDAPNITREDVKTFMSGAVEFSVFELTNAVERKDLAAALYYARLIGSQGSLDASGKRQDGISAAHQVLSMLSARMENLLRARAVVALGGNVGDISRELGMGSWQAESLYKSAQNFGIAGLKQALSVLATEMHATHDTGGDPLLSLERCVVASCTS